MTPQCVIIQSIDGNTGETDEVFVKLNPFI